MLELTPIIISSIIILSAIIGIIIGTLLSKSKNNNIDGSKSNHTFHIDSATGIVSDVT
jgi:hypothetical protein